MKSKRTFIKEISRYFEDLTEEPVSPMLSVELDDYTRKLSDAYGIEEKDRVELLESIWGIHKILRKIK